MSLNLLIAGCVLALIAVPLLGQVVAASPRAAAPVPAEPTWAEIDGELFGAKPDAEGPLGGGPGYRQVVTTGDFQVRDVDGLIAALAQAQAGQVVFIDGQAKMDLTERIYVDKLVLTVPEGVTLASDRGHEGSAGALLYSDAFPTTPMIQVAGPDARITGLRLRGPDPERRLAFHYHVFHRPDGGGSEAYYRLPNSTGIQVSAPRLEVDNCEISAFSYTGVYLHDGQGHQIHHNFIHHCQRMGLGYGVGHNHAAQSRVAFNVFQDNKHHVAGSGNPGQGYEACHNLVLPATESHAHPVTGEPYGQDHLFDMHGGRDRVDGTDIAGRFMHIHHNTFLAPYQAVVIRGVPQEEADIHHNWFARHQPGSGSVVTDGRTRVHDNAYGDPAQPDPMVARLRVIEPPTAGPQAHPARLEVRLHNPRPGERTGDLRIRVEPQAAVAAVTPEAASLTVPAGGEAAAVFEVTLKDQAAAGVLEVSVPREEGLGVLDQTAVPVQGYILPSVELSNRAASGAAIASGAAVAAAKENSPAIPAPSESPEEALSGPAAVPHLTLDPTTAARQVLRHEGRVVAELQFARAGDQLLLTARVAEAAIEASPQVWDGSCVEVFAAPPGRDAVKQVLLVPAADGQPARAYATLQPAPRLDEQVEVSSSPREDGYLLHAAIPFASLDLDPAVPVVRLEFQVSSVPALGTPRVWTTCFGSSQPYRNAARFAYFTVRGEG